MATQATQDLTHRKSLALTFQLSIYYNCHLSSLLYPDPWQRSMSESHHPDLEGFYGMFFTVRFLFYFLI